MKALKITGAMLLVGPIGVLSGFVTGICKAFQWAVCDAVLLAWSFAGYIPPLWARMEARGPFGD